MQKWEVPNEGAWIRVSENLKFFRQRYLSFKNQLENFGVVSRSNVHAYQQIEKKKTFDLFDSLCHHNQLFMYHNCNKVLKSL